MIKIVSWIRYLGYVIRHKWYVMLACFKMGLYWRGVFHDMSKFMPSEFFPYANHFYGEKGSDIKKGRDATGFYPAGMTDKEDFNRAWLHHKNFNDHHYGHWILSDYEQEKIFPMSEDAIKEMICDWTGAAKAQGHPGTYESVKQWYSIQIEKKRLKFHPDTKSYLDRYFDLRQILRNQRSGK